MMQKMQPLAAGLFKLNLRQSSMFLALVAIWLIFGALTQGVFLTPRNISNLFVQTSSTAVLAIGMVLVIVAGHIDLSVGSILGFCGSVAALAMIRLDTGAGTTIALTLVLGILIGAWHGYWIAYHRVPAFIVTLSSMLAFRGAIIGVTDGQTLSLEMVPRESVSNFFRELGQGYIPTIISSEVGTVHDTTIYLGIIVALGYIILTLAQRSNRAQFGFLLPSMASLITKLGCITAAILAFFGVMSFYLGLPMMVALVLCVALVIGFIATKTVFGRRLYALGGNPEAARFSGIDGKKYILGLFMLMGALAAVAGLLTLSRLNAATTSAGQNAELDAIASAVIGGTSLMGGQGTILGALIGAMVMTSLDNGMSLMNLDSTYQYVIKGLILLLAVWIDMTGRKSTP